MKDNTVKSSDGIDVYTNVISQLVDEYIELELDNKPEKLKNISVFTGMLLYISDNMTKPSNDDIELLDSIFNIYTRLCCKYGILPTLEAFSMLVNINPNTLSAWNNGEYRGGLGSPHSLMVKKWKNTCRYLLVNSLQNSRGTDANKIFIAKAAYGMVETAPVQIPNAHQGAIKSFDEIAAEMGVKELPDGEKTEQTT